MWEDEHNKKGGKWIVRLKKGASLYHSVWYSTDFIRTFCTVVGELAPSSAWGTGA